MKTARSNQSQQNKSGMTKKARPENKDNLDSRKAKVADKDRTAKIDKDEKVKTKNPGKKAPEKMPAKTGNKTPKKPAKKAAKKK